MNAKTKRIKRMGNMGVLPGMTFDVTVTLKQVAPGEYQVVLPKTKKHPEDTCQKCGGKNVVWHTSNELWNRTLQEAGVPCSVLCPICFIELAEAHVHRVGLSGSTGWRILPERL